MLAIRKLMWFSIGFGAVCGMYAYDLQGIWILCAVLAAGICVGVLTQKQALQRILAIILCGCVAASLWTAVYNNRFVSTALSKDGAELQLTVTAEDYSYDTSYRLVVDGTAVLEGKQYRVRTYLKKTETMTEITPGDKLVGTFRMRATVPGGKEESTYHQGKGIFLMAYDQGDAAIIPAETVDFNNYPAILVRKTEDVLRMVFPEDVFAFAKALLLGDTYDLDYETDTFLKISGIRHIVAVSGLHISVLYGVIAFLTGRRRFLTAAVGFPVLLVFAAMAGFTPSVSRSCIMVGVMMLSSVFMREYDPPTALSFSCLVLLAANPLTITSVSFQLSVLCVSGIMLFQQPISNWLRERFPGKERWRGWLYGNISVSLSAMSLVTPLSAYYFGTVSLIGVITNLLTLWIVTGIFVGIAAVWMVSFLSIKLASALGWIVAWPIRFVLMTAKLCASVPYAAVYTASIYVVFWLIFSYALLIVFVVRSKSNPGKLLCCSAFGLCLALMLSFMEPLTDELRITMLDVGQGQSIIIQSGSATFLIDCGGDSDTETADIIAEHLLSQGISRLDGIVITHYDSDHAGAVDNILTRVDTDLLILPDTPGQIHPKYQRGEILYLWDTAEITLDNGKLTVYGPVFHGESNENSLCVLFESEKCDILITGDRTAFGERMLMRKAALPDVDILVAGHHGAESASSQELLSVVKPELVLISVGEDNIYGHPTPKVLRRFYDAGISVRRTDLEGTIIIRR